jgi:monofunctional biosynthetic peptidoglycan transglycosylase
MRRRSWKRRLLRAGVGLAVVASLATALPIALLRVVPPLATSFMLRARWPLGPCESIDYDWVGRREIAPAVFPAVVAAEDQRFPDHAGFDLDSIEDALVDRGDGRARGASTISQQVAKNLFLWPGRSWLRKGVEAWITVWIEALWPKPRILEVYVNVAQFGRCTFGVGAAARRFFGKAPGRLTIEEAALLAAVLPNPVERRVDAPSPRVRARAASIARQARRIQRSDMLDALSSSH